MKKLTTILAGLFLLFTASAFKPTEVYVSANLKAIFQQDFSTVANVKWTVYEDIYVASFKENNIQVAAAYTLEGNLLCTGRSISTAQLPAKVTATLQNKYADYNINEEVIEVSTDVTAYVIYAENDKFKLKLSADAAGNITLQEKTKK